MKMLYRWLCLTLVVFFVSACASQPVSPPSEWRYEKVAIHLNLKADPQLNLYEGNPHTLLLCIYQLRDPNAFNQLTEDEDGLYKLLECSRFDSSVANSKRLIVHPGQDLTTDLDRAEGAKYVAIVAGYYLIQKEGMIRLYDIPWYVEKKGFIMQTKVAKPAALSIDLVLGSQQIHKFGE
jgi:type VI secretion system VasD/TssJ family lipoprotein